MDNQYQNQTVGVDGKLLKCKATWVDLRCKVCSMKDLMQSYITSLFRKEVCTVRVIWYFNTGIAVLTEQQSYSLFNK